MKARREKPQRLKFMISRLSRAFWKFAGLARNPGIIPLWDWPLAGWLVFKTPLSVNMPEPAYDHKIIVLRRKAG
jgi:hypothetical protein